MIPVFPLRRRVLTVLFALALLALPGVSAAAKRPIT
jgi:hypothetical protein